MLYTTTPITYGQENKKRAWTQYETLSLQEHQNFVIQNTGLHINAELPYLGVSPDGLNQLTVMVKVFLRWNVHTIIDMD